MRLAVCFSGQPRSINLKENLCKRLLDKNVIAANKQVDVFVHSWFHPSLAGQPFHPNKPYDMGRWTGTEDQAILDLYKPVRYKFDHPDNINDRLARFDRRRFNQHGHIGIQGTFGMFASIYEADKLRQEHEKANGFRYDAVMRMRFDLAIDCPIRANELDLACINTPVNPGGRAGWRCCDMMAISSGKNMAMYASAYLHLDSLIYEYTCNDNEVLLGMHLEKRNPGRICEIWKWQECIWFTGYDLQPKSL